MADDRIPAPLPPDRQPESGPSWLGNPEAIDEGSEWPSAPPYRPMVSVPSRGDGPEETTDLVGQMMGSYFLEAYVGGGGFGRVYRATRGDGPEQQTVALKLLHRGLDSERERRRFQREARVQAKLKHPHIVPLLEPGVAADGRPYLVMEYFPGIPLDQFCDARALTLEQRLELFLQVGVAVQHAHTTLVLHRDLKPGNILAADRSEGGPMVKLVDFGLARFLSPESDGEPDVRDGRTTRTGERLCTPAYASPEQMRGEQVVVTSDIYSLGVVLYELLCGHRPYRFDDVTSEEAIYRPEPEPPSSKVSRGKTIVDAEGKTVELTPEVIGKQRGVARPRQLRQQLTGDLDNICLKALQKEPARRYQSVEELTRDVRSYLAGDPVVARGDPWGYRAGKFVRKHKGKLATVAAVVLVILGFSGWALAERASALDASQKADIERASAIDASQKADRELKRVEEIDYAHSMTLVHHEWPRGNVRGVLRLLDRYKEGSGRERLRDEVWYHYRGLCRNGRSIQVSDNADIRGLAVFPRARILVTGTMPLKEPEETVKFWNLDTGQMTGTLPGFRAAISSLALSRDGGMLATVSYRGPVTVWTGVPHVPRKLFTLPENPSVECVMFTGDGRSLITGHADGTVKLWDLDPARQGKPPAVFRYEPKKAPGPGRIRSLTLAPEDKILATGHQDGTIVLWDVKTQQASKRMRADQRPVYALCFAPDGEALASGGDEGILRMWDVNKGEERWSQQGHEDGIRCLAFSSDGKALVSGGADNILKWWSTTTRKVERTYRGHLDPVTALAFAPGDKGLVTASNDGTVRRWDSEHDPECHTLRQTRVTINSVTFSPDGKELIWGGVRAEGKGSRPVLATLGLAPGQRPSDILSGKLSGTVHSVAYASNGKSLVVGTREKLHLLDLTTGQERELISPEGKILAAVPSPDGRKIATVGTGKTSVTLLETATGAPIPGVSERPNVGHSLAISPNGQWLAIGTLGGTVVLWDLTTNHRREFPEGKRRGLVHAVTFSPDSRTLASGGDDQTVRLWDVADGKCLASLEGHRKPVRCSSFSRDGLVLASGDDEGTVKLWRVGVGLEMISFRVGRERVLSLAFSPSGERRLAAGSDVGTIMVWNMGALPES